ncbi:hypothetical protein REPUB_Repub20aG0097500 [Reevesia pubescens]
MDSKGCVKLVYFGVLASIYESSSGYGSSLSTSLSPLMLIDMMGTPYWMASKVVLSYTRYSFKANIWSFGITVLELAYRGPPLSYLPSSKTLIMKITKRFRFSEYENMSKKDNEDVDGEPGSKLVKHRRISGWNFNEDLCELDPVFPSES